MHNKLGLSLTTYYCPPFDKGRVVGGGKYMNIMVLMAYQFPYCCYSSVVARQQVMPLAAPWRLFSFK
jgi:hypothetical protein